METKSIIARASAYLPFKKHRAPKLKSQTERQDPTLSKKVHRTTHPTLISPLGLYLPKPHNLDSLSHRKTVLLEAIDLIGQAPLTAEKINKSQSYFYSLRSDPILGQEARLWHAICVRIKGEDATKDFQQILVHDPQNRLALLNLIANILTRVQKTFEPEDSGLFNAMKLIDTYLIKRPNDTFAKLLKVMLIFKLSDYESETTLDFLEEMYLSAPSYSPAISLMAILLNMYSSLESAQDYAREAMAKDPNNFQAKALARFLGLPPNADDELIDYVSSSIGPTNAMSMLHAAYFTQDPDYLQTLMDPSDHN